MAPGVKVFGSPTSAEVARVLTCLFEKNIEFQLIRVDQYKGQKRQPDYLKLQPSGQALTFGDEGLTIVDSRMICRHISEKYKDWGTKGLLGSGTLERAAIEQWLLIEEEIFDLPSSALVFHLGFAPLVGLPADKTVVEKSEEELNRILDIYEQRLGESRYLAGDNFTLADLSHLPNTQSLMNIPECRSILESRKKVMGWWDKISNRTSWKKVKEMQKGPPPKIQTLTIH